VIFLLAKIQIRGLFTTKPRRSLPTFRYHELLENFSKLFIFSWQHLINRGVFCPDYWKPEAGVKQKRLLVYYLNCSVKTRRNKIFYR
jgi:hypothetical protein